MALAILEYRNLYNLTSRHKNLVPGNGSYALYLHMRHSALRNNRTIAESHVAGGISKFGRKKKK
jgi:hypothetical protein